MSLIALIIAKKNAKINKKILIPIIASPYVSIFFILFSYKSTEKQRYFFLFILTEDRKNVVSGNGLYLRNL